MGTFGQDGKTVDLAEQLLQPYTKRIQEDAVYSTPVSLNAHTAVRQNDSVNLRIGKTILLCFSLKADYNKLAFSGYLTFTQRLTTRGLLPANRQSRITLTFEHVGLNRLNRQQVLE